MMAKFNGTVDTRERGKGGTGYVSPAAPKGDGFCIVLVWKRV